MTVALRWPKCVPLPIRLLAGEIDGYRYAEPNAEGKKMLIVLILLLLLFGGGGGYYGYNTWGPGGGIGVVLVVILILFLFGRGRL